MFQIIVESKIGCKDSEKCRKAVLNFVFYFFLASFCHKVDENNASFPVEKMLS